MNSCFPYTWYPQDLHHRARKELLDVVTLEDEEADGDKLLHSPISIYNSHWVADVRIASDAVVSAHAAIDEFAGVEADSADHGEECKAEPLTAYDTESRCLR
uniref:Uncharacterized protein n=1 Tax=Oryza sativa subsp. japonica TaxID=39947 RepID=Q67IV6_ORYSJ|nr:hypothetical protein [Oryza sativa Japonica Group]